MDKGCSGAKDRGVYKSGVGGRSEGDAPKVCHKVKMSLLDRGGGAAGGAGGGGGREGRMSTERRMGVRVNKLVT